MTSVQVVPWKSLYRAEDCARSAVASTPFPAMSHSQEKMEG